MRLRLTAPRIRRRPAAAIAHQDIKAEHPLEDRTQGQRPGARVSTSTHPRPGTGGLDGRTLATLP